MLSPTKLRPMLASLESAPLDDPHFAYEPKYDGIRALILVEPAQPLARVTIASRLGNDKTAQFPEIVRALGEYGRKLKAGVLLDGEIVALDGQGQPTGFQQLQGRIHVSRPVVASGFGKTSGASVAFIAFDILFDGAADLRDLPLTARRARLERVFDNAGSPVLRMSEFVPADGRALYERALASGWEGLVAKHLDSRYKSGKRTPDWRKLKITLEQEFVVGGWTEPRKARGYLGALLLGVYEDEALEYVGHTGTGFTDAELRRVWTLLKAREIAASPFKTKPRPNERPHWATPELVAQVRFTEWTADGKLRHPIYLGLRDDVKAGSVHREPVSPATREMRRKKATVRPARAPHTARSSGHIRHSEPVTRHSAPRLVPRPLSPSLAPLVEQLAEIELGGGDGTITLPDGDRLKVGNLDKVFWPDQGYTKGDLMRYYAAVSPVLLPSLADRPLVMKRLPNGIRGKAFYQQRAPEDAPPGVRVESLPDDTEVPNRLVGGSLKSLLYMTQLGAVSQDPWFSRIDSRLCPDHVALDLDPMPGIRFPEVLDVARWAHDELQALHVEGYPKTSGADGLHIYVPLPPDTPYDTAVVFCQLLATLVAQKHSKIATVTRSVHARGRKVYVDYLQNVRGKTLATAYSARASEYAGVSAPLKWEEVHAGIAREDFNLQSMPERIHEVGDLWAGLRQSKGTDLRALLQRGLTRGNRAPARKR